MRHLRGFRFTEDTLAQVMQGNRLHPLSSCLPEGAVLVAVDFNWKSRDTMFTYEHPAFQAVGGDHGWDYRVKPVEIREDERPHE